MLDVFRLILLATLAWHTASCVAKDTARLQTELIFGDNERRWATFTASTDGHQRLSSYAKKEKPSDPYPYIECPSVETIGGADTTPGPKDCKVKMLCDNGSGSAFCTVYEQTRSRRLRFCELIHEDLEPKTKGVPYCARNLKLAAEPSANKPKKLPADMQIPSREDTTIPSHENIEITISTDTAPGETSHFEALKQITLSLPTVPDISKPYRISKYVKGDASFVPACNELPIQAQRVHTAKCVLAVWCYNEAGVTGWRTCLANFPGGLVRSGSLGVCGKVPPEGTPQCDLDDTFWDLPVDWPAPGEEIC